MLTVEAKLGMKQGPRYSRTGHCSNAEGLDGFVFRIALLTTLQIRSTIERLKGFGTVHESHFINASLKEDDAS